MTLKRVKFIAIAMFILSFCAAISFDKKPLDTVVSAADAAETYKTKCAMCHSPKAEKLFDPAKTDEAHVEVILKGKKGSKPPFMPAFEAKGMTADEAKALVAYMRKLKNPDAASIETKSTETKNTVGAEKEAANLETDKKARETIVAVYKTNCAACHSPKAEKLYDPKIKEDEQVQIILKGKKAAKPPHMPGFEAKGITEKQAKALAAYMIELRTPA